MAEEVKWKVQYRHNTLPSGTAGEWFDLPYTGNVVPKYGGTVDIQMVKVPGRCQATTNFSIDGNYLRCERQEHINNGRHEHCYVQAQFEEYTDCEVGHDISW